MKKRKSQPHWVQFKNSVALHRLAEGAIQNRNKWAVKNYSGTTMCGLYSELLWYPGVMSRLGAARCKHCCKQVGIPAGEGTSINANLKESA